MNTQDYLESLNLEHTITMYNGNTINAVKPIGYCAIMTEQLLQNLRDYDSSMVYVLCCIDADTQEMLYFKDTIKNTKCAYHLFLYNRMNVIDTLLGRSFNSIDLYVYIIAQLLDIPITTSKIGFIYHNYDINSEDIKMARCKPYKDDAQMIRLNVNNFKNVPLNLFNDIKTRIIS